MIIFVSPASGGGKRLYKEHSPPQTWSIYAISPAFGGGNFSVLIHHALFLLARCTIKNTINPKTKPAASVKNKLGRSSDMPVLPASGLCTGSRGITLLRSKPNPRQPVYSPPFIRCASKNVPFAKKEIRFIIAPVVLMTRAVISDLIHTFFICLLPGLYVISPASGGGNAASGERFHRQKLRAVDEFHYLFTVAALHQIADARELC